MKCPKCSAEAGSGRFCRSCGAPTEASAAPAQVGSVCPFCGVEVRPGAKFCASCAAPLGQAPAAAPAAVEMTICVNCGAQAKADTKFCKSCGKAVSSGTPEVTPDLMPTAMMASPVQPVAFPSPPPASPPQAPGIAEPARSPRPLAPTPPRMEPPAAPRLVAKSETTKPVPGTQPSGGGNKILVITSVVALALVGAGLVYKFVLHKPTVQSTPAVEATVTAQPATSTHVGTSPDTATTNPDAQPPVDAQTQQPTDATAAGTTAGGKSQAGENGGAAPARLPKRPPPKPAAPGYAQAHANAEQALAASQYLNPPDGSALFWARKAQTLGDPGAAQIEQQIFTKLMADITAARQSHIYDQAQAQLYQLASNFPDHTELRQMQDDIHREQQRYTTQIAEQRRQAELQAQTKKFAVQHRHGAGSSFCTGIITVTPDGVAKYDCNTADSSGRCEHVTFAAGSLKEVKLKGDGSLHVATRQQGNYDFSGAEFATKDAAATLGSLVNH
jgi:double zinc ribbon protein